MARKGKRALNIESSEQGTFAKVFKTKGVPLSPTLLPPEVLVEVFSFLQSNVLMMIRLQRVDRAFCRSINGVFFGLALRELTIYTDVELEQYSLCGIPVESKENFLRGLDQILKSSPKLSKLNLQVNV